MNTDAFDTFIDADLTAAQLPQATVLDCRFSLSDKDEGEQRYRQGHVAGAYYCDLEKHLSAPAGTHGGRHPLPDIQTFSHQLKLWGIGPASHVIVYDDQRCAFAARAWWLLRAVGVRHVQILNGGYRAWVDSGRPQDRRVPPLRHAVAVDDFPFDETQIVNVRQLRDSLSSNNFLLIDSRETPRFLGEHEPIDPVAGHIPGAINKPWTEITHDNGTIKPVEFHQQRWQQVKSQQPAVAYCGSGVTACVNLLSAHLAGLQLSLYPGSWSDWCSYRDTPVATRETMTE